MSKQVNPITPHEAKSKKIGGIPDAVVEVFNELIVRNLSGRSATVKQRDVIKLIKEKMNLKTDTKIFENQWLDIEPVFRKAGWKVHYDKPAYCETYEPTFEFTMT